MSSNSKQANGKSAAAAAAGAKGKDSKDSKAKADIQFTADDNKATLYPFGSKLYNLQLEVVRPAASTDSKPSAARLRREGVHVVFVLDNSGSMGQSFERDVIPIVNQSFERLQPHGVLPDIVIFDSNAYHISLKELQSKRASGGTDFTRALAQLQSVLKVDDTRTHQVVFLTDGQADYPTQQLKLFQGHIQHLRVGVHALGIASYDINFLGKFVEIGTIAGTFQGSEKNAALDLGKAVEKIIELVGGETGRSKAWVHCLDFKMADPFKVAGVEDKADGKAVTTDGKSAASASASASSAASAAASKEDAERAKANAEKAKGAVAVEIVWKEEGISFLNLWITRAESKKIGGAEKVPVVLRLEDGPDIEMVATVVEDATNADLFAGWLAERLAAISQAIIGSENPDVKKLRAIVDEVDKEAQKQTQNIFQLRDKVQRVAVLERMKGVHDLLRGCHEALAQIAVGRLDRDSKARLLNQAYQRRLEDNSCAQKKIAKLVVKRMADNASALETTAAKLAELKSKHAEDYKALAAQMPADHLSTTSFFDYYRSCHWLELLQDGEGLGVSLAMKQRSLGIVAPSLIRIERVNASCLSLDAFIDACKYQLVDKAADPTKIPSILPGMAREDINGALALYIHPLHWQAARLLFPQVLSQMTVGTPLAYHVEQMKTIPFAILMRMVTDLYLASEAPYESKASKEKEAAAAKADAKAAAAAPAKEAKEAYDPSTALTDSNLILFWQVFRTCVHVFGAYKLFEPKNCAFAPLLAQHVDPSASATAEAWGSDNLPATQTLYGMRLCLEGSDAKTGPLGGLAIAEDDDAAPKDNKDNKDNKKDNKDGKDAKASSSSSSSSKSAAVPAVQNPWTASANNEKDAPAAARGYPFYAQALVEEARRWADYRFRDKSAESQAAADALLDGLIDIAGEPKTAVEVSSKEAKSEKAQSPMERAALKAWLDLTKDDKDAASSSSSSSSSSASKDDKDAKKEKPFVFDPAVMSSRSASAVAKWEQQSWKQFELLNAYTVFSEIYAQLRTKHGGRSALLSAIDKNWGVAPDALRADLKAAYVARKAAQLKLKADGAAIGAAAVARSALVNYPQLANTYDSLIVRAAIIQGVHYRTNQDRRDAMAAKKLTSPLVEGAAAAIITAERTRQLNEKKAALARAAVAASNTAAAELFLSTDNMELAAGVLLTQFASRSLQSFGDLHKLLEDRAAIERAVKPVIKLRMVLSGKYKGKPVQDGGKVWGLGRRTLHRLYLAYGEARLPGAELQKVFPKLVHCIDCWNSVKGHGSCHTHRGDARAPKQAPPKPNPANAAKKEERRKARHDKKAAKVAARAPAARGRGGRK